jgi:cytoskeletal protein CcmA (bactofilin family)
LPQKEGMFRNKKSDSSANGAAPSAGPNSNNSIVTGTRIEGNIMAGSDIRIDGELYGDLDCKGRVVIGVDGTVNGTITCQNAVIEGVFIGKLSVQELLNVRETAKIEGDIYTEKLIVQAGAIYNVNCQMGKITKSTPAASYQPKANEVILT